MEITVVGAGVIGLVTARVLADRGHAVRVVARETDDATTSAVAAAVWFPYRVGPRERVVAWAETTRAWLLSLPAAAGVDVLDAYEITDGEPWWYPAAERVAAPVAGAPLAWRYPAPRIEPALFLRWLARDLAIERRTVVALDAEPGDVVVNCSGLGARALAADAQLSPLFGQVVITEAGGWDRRVSITDERAELFYVIPRRDELVVGGCALPRESAAIDPAITERILEHARTLGIAVGPTKRVRAGLRPFRDEVRVERAGRIVHNYGHGGAGFTLCRGCADDVAYLINPRK